MSSTQPQKVLVILMQELSEVIAVGIPAIRYVREHYPEAELHFLTFAQGEQVIQLADPDIEVLAMAENQWPENILQAMEAFLGLAEIIVGQGYDKIINFDTWFMPNFLGRFLKDAGEPLEGNFLSISVQQLIDQIQAQTLQTEYVHDISRYMDSTWFNMARWHTPWWEGAFLPDHGYPEFYLRSCCGFESLKMDMQIALPADNKTKQLQNSRRVIAVALDSPIKERHYPFSIELVSILRKAGIYVWELTDQTLPLRQKIAQLKATDLVVTVPGVGVWLAQSAKCPALLISGDVNPRIFMPDYATDPGTEPIPAEQLADSILSVFDEDNDE